MNNIKLRTSVIALGFLLIFFYLNRDKTVIVRKFYPNLINNKDLIIEETKQYSEQKVDEYDPELIKFVRSLIHEPYSGNRNLTNPSKNDYSQYAQSTYIDNLLNKRENGFYVEAGAYNGEDLSNTLFFEIQRNWSGILIEPVPDLFESIISKRRHAFAINVCIAEKYPSVVKFRIAKSKSLSGISDLMSNKHQKRVGDIYQDVMIPCFSLNTILASINVRKVDFFSLDLEGAELNVLKSMDLKKFEFGSIIVEHNGEQKRKREIDDYLVKNGYKITKSNGQDDFFLKNRSRLG